MTTNDLTTTQVRILRAIDTGGATVRADLILHPETVNDADLRHLATLHLIRVFRSNDQRSRLTPIDLTRTGLTLTSPTVRVKLTLWGLQWIRRNPPGRHPS